MRGIDGAVADVFPLTKHGLIRSITDQTVPDSQVESLFIRFLSTPDMKSGVSEVLEQIQQYRPALLPQIEERINAALRR